MEANLNVEEMELNQDEEGVYIEEDLDIDSDPEFDKLLYMLNRDLFGMDEAEGRDIIIAASDGTEFVAHTSKLYRLFREIILKGETLHISCDDVNFHFWEDGPTTKALLAFLNSNDKALMEESSHVNFRLMKLGHHYKLEDVTAAAIQVFIEKIGTETEFNDQEYLWCLNAWIVTQTDRNNGDLPPELVALKGAISRGFNRQVVNSRNNRIRSPAASQNMFGSYWQMNVNLLL